ncbi:RF-1 domain-containing protein [Exophiala viscosa]|uniref:RF-1 domain-containing protein n=1 Tax=Exophiala viscosa TaxID=2486360 RepID=UPI00219B4BDE|nr:RF-1 domain-containing protein [Exophiala viscosa]
MLLVRQALKRTPLSTCLVKHYPSTAVAVAVRGPAASFSTTPSARKKPVQLPPRPSVSDDEIKHTFVKGSGPGGQKINKTNSAAQVTHLATGIVVKSQRTRSKSENFKIAKRILAEKVELLEKGGESRAAKVHDRARKKKLSAEKKRRRKYKALAEEGNKDGKDDGDEAEEDDGDEDLVDGLEGRNGSGLESKKEGSTSVTDATQTGTTNG